VSSRVPSIHSGVGGARSGLAAGRGPRGLAAGLLAVWYLAASVAADPLAATERVVLGNGLVVLLLTEPGAGLVSVGMMYRVGAKNEAAGTTGLAHYAEHMNFRATTRFPGHEITERVTRRGGRWTGYTWIDQTFYQTTLEKEVLSLALDLEADRMGGALYAPEEFAAERNSVIAELRSYDQPHALLYDEVVAASFQIHPYRNNTIGWLTDVEAVTRDQAFAFYRRFYHPRNAVLAIGGDFDRDEALRAVRDRFESRPAGDGDAHVSTVEPLQAGERRVTVRKPGAHAEVLIAFRAPALSDPDFPAMVLFDALLAGGKGLRLLHEYDTTGDTPLERALLASGLAREAGSAFQASLHPYVYTVRADVETAEGLAPAEAALFASLAEAGNRGWAEDDLRRARAEVRAGLARDLDGLAGRVHQLAFFEVAGGFEHLAGLASRLEATGLDEVSRFARDRLGRERATVGWFVPTPGVPVFVSGQASRPPAPAALTADVGLVDSARAPARPTPIVRTTGPPTTVRLDNGLRLRVTPLASTGLFALRGRVEAGTVLATVPAASVVAADLFALGARRAGGPPLGLALDEDPAAGAADRFLEFEASGLPSDLPDVARAIAAGFAADPGRVEEARARAIDRAAAAEASTEAVLAARARSLLFAPASALSRPPWGGAEALRRLSADEVAGFARRYVTPSRGEVSVAGPLDPAEVRRVFERAFAAAPSAQARLDQQRMPAPDGARGPGAWTVVRVERPDASQDRIHVVLPGDRSRAHDRAATSLLLYLLGETYYSGRLGRALVEPGLAYSVWTTLEEAPGLPGYLLVRTAASVRNTPVVLESIRAVLEDAARGAFTPAELGEAKAYLRGKAARSRDGAVAASAAALDGESSPPSPQAITLEQLNDTARRLFARGTPLALVGGPGPRE